MNGWLYDAKEREGRGPVVGIIVMLILPTILWMSPLSLSLTGQPQFLIIGSGPILKVNLFFLLCH